MSPIPGQRLAVPLLFLTLGALVLAPLGMILFIALEDAHAGLLALEASRTIAAFRLSLGASLAAAAIDLLLGTTIAWALVRQRFFGKAALDALIEIPFALPTAVAGIALATLYGQHGWIGAPLAAIGVHVAYTPLGITLALTFVGLPFIVRSLQRALMESRLELDEVARSLGASELNTLLRIALPLLAPALISSFAAAFARAIGEYGSVIFIAGNLPGQTEIAPLLVVTHLESGDTAGAAAIALLSLLLSLSTLGALALWERRLLRRHLAA